MKNGGKEMKERTKKLVTLLFSIMTAFILVACSQTPDANDETTGQEAGQAQLEPGTYNVETMGHNGLVVMDITVDENSIVDIEVLEHSETGFMGDEAMADMTQEILDKQSLEIEALSGATISGLAVRTGVSQAIEEAGGDVSDFKVAVTEDDTEWEDAKADVVVVGSGAAGLAATIQAEELGMHVILVEQLGLIGGSSVRAGYMVGGDTIVQEQQDIDFSTQDWIDIMVHPRDTSDRGLFQEESALRMASNAGNNIDWLYDLGIEFGPVNLDWQHYGPEGARIGPFATNAFQDALDEREIDYRLNTRADELIMEDDAVVGIVVESPNGQLYNIHADAVILATGGYFANQEMVEKYDPEHAQFPTDVSIGADGSGMLMAEEIGAELKFMDQANYHGIAASWNGASRSLSLPAGNGAIAVNAEGKRYANEAGAYELLTEGTMNQENSTVYTIMDQTLMDLDVIKNDHGLSNIEEMYEVADTIEELAEKLEIDPEGLRETVDNYTSYVQNGEDLEFGKDPANMRSDFSEGPYYGVKSSVENHTNHGGVVVDIDNRALTSDNEVIPGLFAAGEVAASHIQGFYTYQACIENGRISAKVVYEELNNN